jgi:hypothetical protein
MIWDYPTKLRLYQALCDKLSALEESSPKSLVWIPKWMSKSSNKPRTNPAEWNQYLDNLGCVRIVRNKISGWELQDSKKEPTLPWKSMNKPGFVHISNPMYPGNFHESQYIIRVPKEVAEKILVLGLP